MRRTVLAILLAAAAVALAAKPSGTGTLSAVPCNPATTSIGPARPADSDARLVAIRAEQAQAAARGDQALARELESKLQAIYLERQAAPGSAEGATRSVPWNGRSSLALPDVLIDSGVIGATAADYEMDGTMWVAYSKLSPDLLIYVTRSTDHGTTWQGLLSFLVVPTTPVSRLGLIVGQGDSAFVYVFLVHPDQHGDMLCARFNKDGSDLRSFWVKADADSINDFKACRDHSGSGYWLYCVAGNADHSSNFDDFILRSTDYGKTWATLDSFRYVSDGSLTAGAGSYLYMSGRAGFSPYSGQLNLLVNHYWADPDSWHEAMVDPDTFMVWGQVMAPSFVTPPESAVVWTLYSHNYQNSGDWDMMYLYSTSAGTSWNGPYYLAGTSGANEECGDIKPYTEPGNPWMNASYISNTGYRSVFRHYCIQSTPSSWSDTLRINSNSAGNSQSVRPLLVYSPGAPGTGAGCVFTGAGSNNIYWNSPWLTGITEGPNAGPVPGFALVPNPAAENVRFVLPRAGSRLVVYNAVGREVVRLPADAGRVWNRVDAHGNRMPAGVYIVHFVTPEGLSARRLVLR